MSFPTCDAFNLHCCKAIFYYLLNGYEPNVVTNDNKIFQKYTLSLGFTTVLKK